MVDTSEEGKKVEVLSRLERFRELIEQDAPGMLLEAAFDELARSLEGYMRPGRAEGEPADGPVEGELPPSL